MLTISNTDQLPDHLAEFIRDDSPWIDDGFETGDIFVIDDEDIGTTIIKL